MTKDNAFYVAGFVSGIGLALVVGAIASMTGCAGAETMGGYSPPLVAAQLEEIPGVPTASQVSCSDVAVLTSTVASKYGEELTSGGALGEPDDPNKAWAALLYVNRQTRTWTLATARPDGRACVQFYGSGWGNSGPDS